MLLITLTHGTKQSLRNVNLHVEKYSLVLFQMAFWSALRNGTSCYFAKCHFILSEIFLDEVADLRVEFIVFAMGWLWSAYFLKTRLVLSGRDTASLPLETTTAEKRTECQLVIISKTLTCKSACKLQSSTFHFRFSVTVSIIKGCVTIECVSHIQIRTML